MLIKYKTEPVNGPLRPATVVFLSAGPDAIDGREELSSFRVLLHPHLASGAFRGGYLDCLPLHYPPDTWLLLVGLGKSEALTETRVLEAAETLGFG